MSTRIEQVAIAIRFRSACRLRLLQAAATIFIAMLVLATRSSAFLAEVEYEFFLVEAFDLNQPLREVGLRDVNESNMATGTATNNGFYDGFVWTVQTDKVIVPMLYPQGVNNLNQIVGDGQI
jgi:hypothetical protein